MAVFGLFSVVMETTWLANWPTASLHLDLVVIAVAVVSFYHERREALPVIIFYGLIMDIASSGPWGMSVFSYLVIYGLMRTVISKISFHSRWALFFWVFVVSITDKLLCAVVLLASTGELTIPRVIFKIAPLQAAMDALFGVIFVPLINWYSSLTWEKITRPKGLVLK